MVDKHCKKQQTFRFCQKMKHRVVSISSSTVELPYHRCPPIAANRHSRFMRKQHLSAAFSCPSITQSMVPFFFVVTKENWNCNSFPTIYKKRASFFCFRYHYNLVAKVSHMLERTLCHLLFFAYLRLSDSNVFVLFLFLFSSLIHSILFAYWICTALLAIPSPSYPGIDAYPSPKPAFARYFFFFFCKTLSPSSVVQRQNLPFYPSKTEKTICASFSETFFSFLNPLLQTVSFYA